MYYHPQSTYWDHPIISPSIHVMSSVYRYSEITYSNINLGWLSWLSVGLQLRSWSHSLWVWALNQACCCQCRACLGSSVPPSLCPFPAHTVSQKQINLKKTHKFKVFLFRKIVFLSLIIVFLLNILLFNIKKTWYVKIENFCNPETNNCYIFKV